MQSVRRRGKKELHANLQTKGLKVGKSVAKAEDEGGS